MKTSNLITPHGWQLLAVVAIGSLAFCACATSDKYSTSDFPPSDG